MKTTNLATLILCSLCALLFTCLPRLNAANFETSLEGYGTVAWTGLDGSPVTGVGATLNTTITKGFSLTLSGESDNTTGDFVDRAIGGLRYTASFGKRVSGDLGLGLGYDLQGERLFARIPAGLNFYALKTKHAGIGVRVAYALDVSGSAKHGTSDGRGFVGPVGTIRF